MICSRCGTNIDDNVTECDYCGLKFKTNKPQEIYTVPDLSDNEENTGKVYIVVAVFIIIALIIGAAIYYYCSDYKLEEKYSDLTNKYGLTNQQIEDNISGFYYKTWYYYDNDFANSSATTVTFTTDKVRGESEEEKYTADYKVTQISRKNKNNVFTMRMLIDDAYVSLAPYTKMDDYGNKLYDYIVSYDSDNKEVIFYDRPIEQISISDRVN